MFDWGVLCSTESGVIVDAPIKEAVVKEFKKQGAYFVSPEELYRLGRTLFDSRGAINPDLVGKPPHFIAQKSGFEVPHDTTCIIAEIPAVGREHPLSREKLSPVLSMFTVNGWVEGCERCIEMLQFGGIGHSMVIHSSDSEVILKFGLEKPAFRVLVNTQAALGAVGYTNELTPSMTLGPGTFGGSIISDNVSARHLINVKRLAFETRPINPPLHTQPPSPVPSRSAGPEVKAIGSSSAVQSAQSWMEIIDERIRAKAGNAPSTAVKSKEQSAKPEPLASPEQPTKKPEAGFGTGISESEIEKIIREFRK
jgi:acetaldehyde dehydrogenase (acetylating)